MAIGTTGTGFPYFTVPMHQTVNYESGLIAGIDKIIITARDLLLEYKDPLKRVYHTCPLYSTDTPLTIFRDHAGCPDSIDRIGVDHQWYHGYNPATKIGQAPKACKYYTMRAWEEKGKGYEDLFYYYMSLASHYLVDQAIPFHTTGALYQDQHLPYEAYLDAHIMKFIPTMKRAKPIHITGPEDATISLAKYSNKYAVPLWTAMRTRNLEEVDKISDDLIEKACGYSAGLLHFVPKEIEKIVLAGFTVTLIVVVGMVVALRVMHM